uniref:Uncharacterized protein n=1 Tax=Anopheles quadriannulatus TaxID=34691 RepID=A0A182XGN0_ANOQN
VSAAALLAAARAYSVQKVPELSRVCTRDSPDPTEPKQEGDTKKNRRASTNHPPSSSARRNNTIDSREKATTKTINPQRFFEKVLLAFLYEPPERAALVTTSSSSSSLPLASEHTRQNHPKGSAADRACVRLC